MKTCCIHDCENIVYAKNLCSKHYSRRKRHDDTSVNYRLRMNRLMIYDNSTYIQTNKTVNEIKILQELFCMGRHQGPLRPNYNEAIGRGNYDMIYDI